MGKNKNSLGIRFETDSRFRFRDDWAVRHFLHPKLLRKAREVRAQLEDIMNFQKMEMISTGTDFDVLRSVIRQVIEIMPYIWMLPSI